MIGASGFDTALEIPRELSAKNQILSADRAGRAQERDDQPQDVRGYPDQCWRQLHPNPQRYGRGWYTVRVVGFLSSILVLILLLYEVTNLYGRLLGAILAQRREREVRLMTGTAVAASIAHELKQPLTAMVTSADAGFRFLDRPMPNLARAMEAFKLIAADGHRAGAVVEHSCELQE